MSVVCLSVSKKNDNWVTIFSEGVWGVVEKNNVRKHIQVGTFVMLFIGNELLAFGEVERVLDDAPEDMCDALWVRNEWKSSNGSGANLVCKKIFWMRNIITSTGPGWDKKGIMTRLGHPNCNLQSGLHVVDEAFAAELRDISLDMVRARASPRLSPIA